MTQYGAYRHLGHDEPAHPNSDLCGHTVQADIMGAIATKMDRYRNPWQELRLQYGANKGKAYTGASSHPD